MLNRAGLTRPADRRVRFGWWSAAILTYAVALGECSSAPRLPSPPPDVDVAPVPQRDVPV